MPDVTDPDRPADATPPAATDRLPEPPPDQEAELEAQDELVERAKPLLGGAIDTEQTDVAPDLSAERTVVHLVRHGEVYNPEGILYGRLPGFRLSERGHEMARRLAEHFADADLVHLVVSPLERTHDTAMPLARAHGLTWQVDERVVEAGNKFEGKRFGVGDGAFRHPRVWWLLRNPFRPSWGEPYREIAQRMLAAMADARDAARGRDAVIVSHQLPVWIVRSHVERRRFAHDPRRRECNLASVTSITYAGDAIVGLTYAEPAADLVPGRTEKKFVAGA